MLLINDTDYRNLRWKGYTNTLIEHLLRYDPNRLCEMISDPWAYPFLGDPSAPVEQTPAANPHTLPGYVGWCRDEEIEMPPMVLIG